MQTRHKIGILGATGVIGQRFIQLLEGHPWFEITWLAASDKTGGKTYGEAVRWKLETPLPSRIAGTMVSPAAPEGAPGVIFAALDTDIARELELQELIVNTITHSQEARLRSYTLLAEAFDLS